MLDRGVPFRVIVVVVREREIGTFRLQISETSCARCRGAQSREHIISSCFKNHGHYPRSVRLEARAHHRINFSIEQLCTQLVGSLSEERTRGTLDNECKEINKLE
jgi:hypothetical protein